jgi:hypothetical protein
MKHLPSEVLERSINLLVAPLVPKNLGYPELRVRFGNSTVFSAAVPEAPVDKDCETKSSKD